jgi:hypothetical protein
MRPGRAAVARGSRTIPPDQGALFYTSILAACGQRSPVPEPCSYPGSKSTGWKSALAGRTRSQTPLTKLEAVGQVFRTSDPDEGARAAALIEQAITHNAH